MIRLLLVNPTRMSCELFSAVLREEADIHVVGYAHTSDKALEQLEKQDCDVVLVDINLPSNDTLCFVRSINQKWDKVKVLITGLVQSNAAILRCVEEGVAGYVHQEESLADLVKKIRAAHEGEFIIAPAVASMLMARVAELKQMTKELYGLRSNHVDELFTELTPREWEVLQFIEQGFSNQDIADKLIIEKGTVKNHVHNILSKLDVHCREQAAVLARQLIAGRRDNSAIDAEPVETFSLAGALDSKSRYARSNQHAQLS